MKIGFVQNNPIFGEKEKNFQEVRNLLRGVEADLLVLPEFFATGYAFASKEEAEVLGEVSDGQTADFLKEISVVTGAAIVGGFVETADEKIYNSALVVHNGETLGTYRKIHLFNKEKLWFDPGNKPVELFDIGGVKLGVMICFDWIFPELCRTLALQGMQILAHPSNRTIPHCKPAMVTRCLENRIFAITTNRVGHEKRGEHDLAFNGMSQITAPDGDIIAFGPSESVQVSIVEIDEKQATKKRINKYNDLFEDRREEFYGN